MEKLEDLIEKRNKLRNGYISRKVINGKERFYFQFYKNGKIISKYLKKDEFLPTFIEINQRKEIDEKIKKLTSDGNNLLVFDKNTKNRTGYIMSGDIIVADFVNNYLVDIDEKRAPLSIKRTKNLSSFLKSRCIDESRTNARLLKSLLKIKDCDDEELVLSCYARSLTDNFWFKPRGSRVKFKDISFKNDFYSDVALKGQILVYPKKSKITPELTLVGSYEKCWKLVNKNWVMYKSGTEDEIYSEIISSTLALKLGIPTAIYEREGKYIITQNFAEKFNFEPMSSIAGENDSIENVFLKVYEISKEIAKEYLILKWFDCLVNNVDRHNENCGFLRDKKSGKIISLAPNFDNNLTLISRSRILNLEPSKDGLISIFKKFLKSCQNAKELFKKIELPILNNDVLNEVFTISGETDFMNLKDYILDRYLYIKAFVDKL